MVCESSSRFTADGERSRGPPASAGHLGQAGRKSPPGGTARCRPQPPRGSGSSGRSLQTKVQGASPRVQLRKKVGNVSIFDKLPGHGKHLVLTFTSICAYPRNQREVRGTRAGKRIQQ